MHAQFTIITRAVSSNLACVDEIEKHTPGSQTFWLTSTSIEDNLLEHSILVIGVGR